MHGMFRANGGCGYVRKPDFLMYEGSNEEVFDPKTANSRQKNLKVSILVWLKLKIIYFEMFFLEHICYLTGDNIYGRWMAVGLQSHTL